MFNGLGKKLFTAVWLLIIAGAVLAFFRVNNIHNASQLYDYFHSWSNKADQCYGDRSR